MTERRYDAVIVGYGPVGQVLANLLGQYGLTVAVFEIATSVYNLPRAVHFDAEVMRVFQSAGLAEGVLPTTAPIKGVDFLTGDGETLFGVRTERRRTSNGWDSDYMFYQPDLEAVLRAGVERFPKVEVFPGHEVTDIRQDHDGVEVDARRLADGETFSVAAAYLVGCDGARSVARRLAGMDLEDLKFDQPWLVIDTMLKRKGVDLPEVALQICDPARPVTFVPSSGNHRRWEIMLMPGDDPDEIVKMGRVWELLGRWITPDDAEVIRHVVYTFHAVIADLWRVNRVLIAGDAAHQMPPFLGQGMCAGIRDVANLAWKLDAVVHREAPDSLLDTYQAERAPHVRAIIERAVVTGNLIQTTDPAVARARDERFRSADRAVSAGDTDGPFSMPMPRLGDGVFVPSGDAGGCGGGLFPQGPVRLADSPERLLDDVIGNRFAVLAGTATAQRLSERSLADAVSEFGGSTKTALIALGAPEGSAAPEGWTAVADENGVTLDWLGGNAALVRPDRYVFGVASDSKRLGALIARLRQHLVAA